MRAPNLGIRIGELEPGTHDAITDVEGVRVGHTTVIAGDDVRTGVTVVVPRELPLFAGCHRLNGNGELTGLEWVRESGCLTTPIGITNTFSVGVVRDAIAAESADDDAWSLPVVGETWDGFLNDAMGQHVTAEHTRLALASAAAGVVDEGCVGGGTGMICHGFKGGIGTASRRAGDYVVGVLVQANHGRRRRFRVNGVPVGELVGERIPLPRYDDGGSIIVIVATDAPLLPHQCDRLAQRAGIGVGRMGGLGENSSGDLFFAFASGNTGLTGDDGPVAVRMLPNERIDMLFEAVVDATEEAILNALLAAETATGFKGRTVHALDAELLLEALRPQVS
ncbi:MAG TPA: P1 family peptidase [Gaiellaceae bacterium]|nr:P1 family peptidase [Gaiellaceae bacterium]